MGKIDSVYNYYINTYANQEVSRYDSHKKSDLRKVYNKIIDTNKESPLYKILNVADAAKYAIDIKENAKSIQNVVASLSDQHGGFSESFQKKVAESSDEDMVSVTYVGNGQETNLTDSFNIEIQRLATPQVNTGNYLKDDDCSFTPGNYSFDLNTNLSAYEFQYNVEQGETNRDMLDKLARLVNGAGLGITANVLSNEGESALCLTSKQTGLSADEDFLFSISPSTNTESIKMMDLLGINNVTASAENSLFLLNGVERSSLSNTFTINNAFELTLNNVNKEGQSTTIGFKTNTDSVADNIQTLVDAYNNMLQTSKEYCQEQNQGKKLFTELSSISRNDQSNLEYIGLMVDSDGSITIDRDLLSSAIQPERSEATFQTLTRLKDAIGFRAENASINPMQYVNKIVVTYKNPGHNFATPYISSIYSGMLLDRSV